MSSIIKEESIPAAISLTGAAAPALYITTSDKIIKDTQGMGSHYVKESLENNVKDLIKTFKIDGVESGKIAITENERAMERAKAAKEKSSKSRYGFKSKKEKNVLEIRAKREQREKEGNQSDTRKKNRRLIKSVDKMLDEGLQRLKQKEETLADSVTTQTMKNIVRTPRYTSTLAYTRYASKLTRDVKAGILTSTEARLQALKHGKVTIKEINKAVSSTIGREIKEFYGSDDLGIETVRRTKDFIINTNQAIKVTSRATKRAAEGVKETQKQLERTVQNMQKAAQKAKKTAEYTYQGIKVAAKALANPVVLKTIIVALLIILLTVGLCAGISAITSLISGHTYTANDVNLNDTYAFITELDTDLALEIQNIPNDKKWRHIDKFHINAVNPHTDPIPIISYLSTKYDDFKFNSKIKNELKNIHSELYTLKFREWKETVSGSNGSTSTIYHLDVTLEVMTWEAYIMKHKNEMFPKKDDYERYETYNRIGGTTLRTELGMPFPDQVVIISSRYGYRINPITKEKEFHTGIDIPMPGGTPIKAVMGGTVTRGYDSGYGNYVIITSGNKKTLYAHCQLIEVSDGQQVKRGEVIATVGNTGLSTGQHLHLEYEKDGKKLNPAFYIDSRQFANLGVFSGLSEEALSDEQFRAIITEAEKYLGMKYVFGGKSPQTGFDCSGFVSWVFTQSGVRSVSTDAQGLYNLSTPVSYSDIKPGDLVFFQGTYDTPKTVTHVGIYVGNGMMIHAGDPIQYASFETPYWQRYFYGFGRLN